MSSTRHAKPGGPFRQERYASSGSKGLMGNLVALRCRELPKRDRLPIWFAQWLSWQPDEWKKLLDTMRSEPEYLLDWGRCKIDEELSFGPSEERIDRAINDFCLNPVTWNSNFAGAIDLYLENWKKEHQPAGAETIVTRKMSKAIRYAQANRYLTVIDGPAQIGKSFAARQFCQQSAGLVRYAQAPCRNDFISFIREIATAVGVSAGKELKAWELTGKVEEVLRSGDLTLVIDEAHYCWPQAWNRYSKPERINWLLTALVNHGVPVVLVTTPQFYSDLVRVEELTKWNSAQLKGRIRRIERLPAHLEWDDLLAVAKAQLPEGDSKIWEGLAGYAQKSQKNLASIEAVVSHAHWLAQEDGRDTASLKDIRQAMEEGVMPSDSALESILAECRQKSARQAGRKRQNDFAEPPPRLCERMAMPSRAPGLVTM